METGAQTGLGACLVPGLFGPGSAGTTLPFGAPGAFLGTPGALVEQQRRQLQRQQELLQSQLRQHQHTAPADCVSALGQGPGALGPLALARPRRGAKGAGAAEFVSYQQQLVRRLTVLQEIAAQHQRQQQYRRLAASPVPRAASTPVPPALAPASTHPLPQP